MNKETAINCIRDFINKPDTTANCEERKIALDALGFLEKETVSAGVCEQFMWERDVTVSQLKELGYSLGEKIRTDDDAISRQYLLKMCSQEGAYDYVSAYEIANAPNYVSSVNGQNMSDTDVISR